MLIFAHRGASADAPENTLLAIDQALTQQADGIEIDVYQLGNELVVIHDRWVSRTTNGNRLLSDYTLEELQTLDAGQGQFVPTLWQVLERVQGQCLINIEMKGVDDVSLVNLCINKAVSQLNFKPEQFIVSSFNHHLLLAFKSIAPNIKVSALTASTPLDYARFAQELQAYSVNAEISFVDKAFVIDAHNRGLKMFVYTVDEPADLLRLKAWGVDAVFSNGPAKAKQALAANAKKP
ncbi:glycerophosphodiester phosphodiesterase family protein [Paraglaciecola sp. MB-3u-78]|jgi:glycerophosphoryl diester phosphodiesterase|uniref:glycerophosphodiester phosphodiesterase n=1 Tax=Paraglaciecola sp. MB-3u-78 TaxID=2058332 RepID=UPI000C337283|nr:glycerophosphodiester phosphodiesterase family protein [Paraglaciecola sp. MB-3u-78]PKG93394.1 glycerophosphodiester phosphodiesterase [Paraglaciecola sp. MB-3u-78]